MNERTSDIKPIFNLYTDSIGNNLKDYISLLEDTELKNAFGSTYILPSIFNSDLDRGFSVIDYELNHLFATKEDLKKLNRLGINLMFDFVLNHLSVLSEQFQDLLEKGEKSLYKNFFINWNDFWQGCGNMTSEGYIRPEDKYIKDMFFRKEGLPLLMVGMPDGRDVPYWNTFYKKVIFNKLTPQRLMKILKCQYLTAEKLATLINAQLDDIENTDSIDFGQFSEYRNEVCTYLNRKKQYLGQMDLNINSQMVWKFYEETIKKLRSYGAGIIRLDAFAYAPKSPGKRNFLNEPDTWEFLDRINKLAEKNSLEVLPEIHAGYEEKTNAYLAEKGYLTYDFFLPGLILNALEEQDGTLLKNWADEIICKKMRVVNMLGCHDGIPLLDLKGLLSDEQIKKLMDKVVERGGYIKNLHGQKNIYYQVNAAYYSALGEKEEKLLAARALQLFMPGIPQIWYLDLFAGKNDYRAVKRAGEGGHKEINRTNLSLNEIKEALKRDVTRKQIEMLCFRNRFPAFHSLSNIQIFTSKSKIDFIWDYHNYRAELNMNLEDYSFVIKGMDRQGEICFLFKV